MAQAVSVPGAHNFLGLRNIRGLQKRGYLDYLMDAWHTYGDFFFIQLGSGGYYFAVHPDLVQQISQSDDYSKEKSYEATRKFVMGDGLVPSRGELWRWQRAMFAPFFTPRGILDYLNIMIHEAGNTVDSLDEIATSGEFVDVAEVTMRYSAKVILQAVFGVSSDDSVLAISDDVETVLGYSTARLSSPFNMPLWWPSNANTTYKDSYGRLQKFVQDLIIKRRATPEDEWPVDLLSKMMQSTDERMTDKLIFDNAMTFFVAGHETTARGISFALYMLSQHPEAEAKLMEEIDRVIGSGAITVEGLKQMPYSLQVIKETLRIFPIATFFPRDVINETSLQGYNLPVGSNVFMFPYATHRHPDFWDRPEVFDPERFNEENEAKQHNYAYLPFAAGKRVCIGNNFSLMESQVFLVALYQRLSLRMKNNHDLNLQVNGALMPMNGLPMRVVKR